MASIVTFLNDKWVRAGAITLVVVICSYVVHYSGLLNGLELKSLDWRFHTRGEMTAEETDIVIVAIDDQSFVSLRQKWPFPRVYFARAIRNLSEAGARLIVFDIEFAEPTHEDYLFAHAVTESKNVIFAGKIAVEYGSHQTVNRYIIKPTDPLLKAGATWGYANVGHDEDGFIRRYNLFQVNNDRVNYPLGIETVRVLDQVSREKIEHTKGDHLLLGNRIIPKYSYDSMFINFSGPAGTFPTYSLSNVLDDAEFDLPEEEDTDVFEIHKEAGTFKDKIVLIGASAEELQDNKFTPFFDYDGKKQKMPGVEMHANAIQTILSQKYIFPMHGVVEFIIILLLSTLAMFFAKMMKPFVGLITSVSIILLVLSLNFFLFAKFNVWAKLIFPIMAYILSYGVHTVHQVLTEQREKGLYRKTFQQYVARSVVDTMLNSGKLPKFGGERKTLTVLFSDIRAFTTFSEKHQPEIVVNRLTEYLSSMVDIIFRHDGTLDKFVGDEIMALYGAPYYYENHAERACHTALDMMAELRHLQRKWSEQQMDYFQIGIGINTGKVIVGNLGSMQLFDYTVIGDEVNLGARLEGANKHYSTTIIISDSTYQEVKGKALVRELDTVRVKGKKKPVKIFELRGMYNLPSIEKELIIDSYTYGLELFKMRNWYQALRQFRRVLRYFPSDGPARIYIKRCLDFIEEPPEDSWDGVFEFSVK